MPRPGTPVIPAGWAAHHRPTLAATWTATGAITHPSSAPGVFNPSAGRDTVTTPTTVWSGPLRLQQLTRLGDGQIDFGEQSRALSTARVTLPLEATPDIDDRLTIVTADDPELVGTVWRVVATATNSFTWARDLIVESVRG
jgi:hypothetical protein